MIVKYAEKNEKELINKIIVSAFSTKEGKKLVHLIDDFIQEKNKNEIISLTAVINNEIVGFVSFSPIFFNENINISGYILAPVAVLPRFQNQGVGTELINTGMKLLKKDNLDFLFVYGHPKYYSKFGFNKKDSKLFIPPYKLGYPNGWLGINLTQIKIPKTEIKFSCIDALSSEELW